jgi:hypothetical protein
VDDLLGRMTLAEKVGQMTQVDVRKLQGDPANDWDRGPLNDVMMRQVLLDAAVGSVLSGGGASPAVSTCCTGDLPANAIDGNSATRWSSGAAQAPASRSPSTWDRRTRSTRWSSTRAPAAATTPRRYAAYTSDDSGGAWLDAATGLEEDPIAAAAATAATTRARTGSARAVPRHLPDNPGRATLLISLSFERRTTRPRICTPNVKCGTCSKRFVQVPNVCFEAVEL